MTGLAYDFTLFTDPPNPRRPALVPPISWESWLSALFPTHVTFAPAQRHRDLWVWGWGIDLGSRPRPFVGVWPRGGGKSTSAELLTAACGLRGTRKYALYVRSTQEQADKSVTNIAALLESATVERYYPEHAERMLSKWGSSRGWRRNRLRTNGGFTVDAIGLDTAARGVKVEEHRPDLIILDDIDEQHDPAGATVKKTLTITTSILPAGSSDVAVLAIQNLIIPDGVFSQLADGRADWLSDRIVSGPHPAIVGLETEWEALEGDTRQAVIIEGVPTWAGQNLTICQKLIHTIGLSSFLTECQHDVKARKEGLALKYTDAHLIDLTDEQVIELVKLGSVFGGIDFGAWRFGMTLFAVDTTGVIHTIAEYFSQKEELSVRARAIHELCARYGITRLKFRGDAANPTDIMELNAAWARGWTDAEGKHVVSRLRVSPVAQANKERATSVERINELLSKLAIRFRRTLGSGAQWRLGWNASSAGTEQTGSRLLWEIQHWSYPIPLPGKAQSQDPDDNTADGSDAIASLRYAIMSYLRPGKEPEEEEPKPFSPEALARDATEGRKVLKKRAQKRRERLIDPHLGGVY